MSEPTLFEKGHSEGSIPPLKIAVEGCGHGGLDLIYNSLEKACTSRGWDISELDFLIICGDFEALRNSQDLNCMSVPPRYRHMGDFHKYYSGEKRAPVLTLVIGGNHEASNYFSELHHGGWLAPNMYYLGYASVIRYGPFRIAGMSGIFKGRDYRKGHHERLPYSQSDIHSIFHVRVEDISQLLQIRSPVDIGLSHDWPCGVEWGGNAQQLFLDRPHFFESIKEGRFGSEPAEKVLHHLRPTHWFSGHMHVKYTAELDHNNHPPKGILDSLNISKKVRGQLQRALSRRKNIPGPSPPKITNTVTHFLALDKPGPNREFIQLLEVSPCCTVEDASTKPYMQKTPSGKFTLHYDEEWLSIERTHNDTLASEEHLPLIIRDGSNAAHTNKLLHNLHWVRANITAKELLPIPENFTPHAPVYDPYDTREANRQPREYPNSQTEAFCRMLQIRDKFSDEGGVLGGGGNAVEESKFVVFE